MASERNSTGTLVFMPMVLQARFIIYLTVIEFGLLQPSHKYIKIYFLIQRHSGPLFAHDRDGMIGQSLIHAPPAPNDVPRM